MPSLKNRQSSDQMNHGDRATPSDPNAMGATMRPPYDASASGPEQGADMHNGLDLYPQRSNGVIGVSRGKR